jgi:hypothetical protein
MNLTNYNIEWSYKAKKVWISPRGDQTFPTVLGSRGIYDIHSSGCCYSNWNKKELENVYRLFVFFIKKEFDFQDTYNQFLKIKKFKLNEAAIFEY